MRWTELMCCVFLVSSVVLPLRPGLAQETRRAAEAADPIQSIIEAFDAHDLVALTAYMHEEEWDFWISLLHTSQFQAAVNDIVVEFGTARYQDIMDRFTSGEDVSYDQLKGAWQQTTQPHHFNDPPMVEAFFRTLREINLSLPKDEQIRAVLAEPPIDWSTIQDFEDLLPWLQERFPYEAEVVEREVLAQGRKALLMSGAGHYLNGTPLLIVIRERGKSVFRIETASQLDLASLQPNVVDWPTPSLALVNGTVLGAYYLATGNAPPAPLEENFDAVLYLGPPSSLTSSRIAPELCSDEEYLDMRLPRLQMAAENGAPAWLEDFVEYCGSVAGQEFAN